MIFFSYSQILFILLILSEKRIAFRYVSFLIRLNARGQRRRSYETSRDLNSEPQNIEQRTSNFEGWFRYA